jgi:hypothetical protein
MAAGLLLALAALFMAPMSLRETCTLATRGRFVLDEYQLDFFSEDRGPHSSPWVEGRLVSTGERYVIHRMDIVGGLDLLLRLAREHRLEGRRVAVRYLPAGGFWFALDRVNPFRVQSPEEFDLGFPTGLVLSNLAIAVLSFALIRRGAGFPRSQATRP